MDMQSIIERSKELKETITKVTEQEAQKARQEKLDRIVEAVAEKAMKMAESGKITFEWMANEATKLKEDVKVFLNDEKLYDYIQNGCAVFFGRVGFDAIAKKDCGAYILSLEHNIEGARFPRVLKIDVRAHTSFANFLSRVLNVNCVSIFSLNELLKGERDGKLPVRFVPAKVKKDEEALKKIDFSLLAQTTITICDCVEMEGISIYGAIVNGELLITRDDWFDEASVKNDDFVFDVRRVPRNPRI